MQYKLTDWFLCEGSIAMKKVNNNKVSNNKVRKTYRCEQGYTKSSIYLVPLENQSGHNSEVDKPGFTCFIRGLLSNMFALRTSVLSIFKVVSGLYFSNLIYWLWRSKIHGRVKWLNNIYCDAVVLQVIIRLMRLSIWFFYLFIGPLAVARRVL